MPTNSSLDPARIFTEASQERFQDSYRRWQGIPSIEVTDKGRIFVNFYSGQDAEVGGNIMVLCVSDDGGASFRSCEAVVEHPDPACRIYDPCLWIDPHKVLWMTWTQARGFNDGRSGVWVLSLIHISGRLNTALRSCSMYRIPSHRPEHKHIPKLCALGNEG